MPFTQSNQFSSQKIPVTVRRSNDQGLYQVVVYNEQLEKSFVVIVVPRKERIQYN